MKVLKVINSLITAGAEKLVAEMIPKYLEQGIEVELLLLNDTEYPLLQELRKNSEISIHTLSNGSVYNPLHIFRIIPFLKRYDVVHVHLFPSQYWVLFAKLLRFSKVKLVFTEHCTTNRRLEVPLFRFFNKFVYKYYEKNVCITNEIQQIYMNFTGLPKEKFPVIENGIDLEKIKIASRLEPNEIDESLSKDDVLILQVAAFREQKDQQTLIRAMAGLPDHFKLLLVGEGLLLSTCQALAKELNIGHRVLFLGIRTDIPKLLKTADVIVLSTHYEGLSLSSIEGMAASKPFFGSDVPGLRELVDGAGILFTEGDAIELTDKILEVINDVELYQKISEACYQRAQQYDIHTMTNKYLELYKTLTD